MTPAGFRQAFRVALDHLNAGALADADAACAVLRRAAPDDPAVLQLEATIALRHDRPEAAWQLVSRVLAMRPGHRPSVILAAQAARAMKRLDLVVPLLRQAIEQSEPAFLLCGALLDLGDPSFDAVFAWVADHHPGRAAEWQQLGVALQRASRPQAALQAFSLAAAADPALTGAHFGRGLLLRDAGRMQEAAAALQRCVALDPAAAAAWFALGLTRQDLGDEVGAAEAFSGALTRRPDFAEAAVNLGIALQRTGDMGAAMTAYRTAMRVRPDTFGRIAQAVTSARTGMLWLSMQALRTALA